MTEWPDADYLPTVSIGPDSLIPQETLDFEASRFLAGTETGLPRDPIRVFVGVHVGTDGRGASRAGGARAGRGSAPSSAAASS